jgi:ribosome biogenesis GTPase / thiamine phosphate phosphatase
VGGHIVSLSQWGWNSYFEAQWNSKKKEHEVAARVVAQHRKYWRVAGAFGECLAEASGSLRLAADGGADWPAVGDWVALELHGADAPATIQSILPRRSRFSRKTPGKRVEDQVIAANVDTVLLVSALDGDFNPRRVERYLAQTWESGAKPVLVLNKADVCDDLLAMETKVRRIAMDTPVCFVSAKTGEGIEGLEPFLTPGHTLVLLGSSGVGKSTLSNRLLGQSIQKTSDVRAGDGRGRHTTTARELFVLPGGALLIDTPGLRELQLWHPDDGLGQTFADIESLAAQCRFGNCTHETEPGCAVQSALKSGLLDAERLENHKKLIREQEFLLRKIDPAAQSAERRRIKQLTKSVREIYRRKDPD